ncbi:hypothetical protein AAX08_09535 [Moraxella bovoculi]|nr:hypothetical protein AAX08_09535 [Moraxella bovoculi]
MFYVRVNRGEFNLKHIKTICGRVLVWNEEHHQLSDDQIKKKLGISIRINKKTPVTWLVFFIN